MKKILVVLTAFFAFTNHATAQDSKLRIYHRLGNDVFSLNADQVNDLGHSYRVERLEYYITRISLVHDGNQTTYLNDTILALIDPSEASFSDIDLGNLSITNLDSVKFHIGVFAPVNNEDPAQYPAGHPLAPKSPSMHWGWSSGYRFLALEGKSGSGFLQTYQLHGLWNENYFETSVNVDFETVNGTQYIAVNADYNEAFNQIDMNSGPVAHGSNEEDLTALENFRDFVFSPKTDGILASTLENEVLSFSVYPNPILSDRMDVRIEGVNVDSFEIYNGFGQFVQQGKIIDNKIETTQLDQGIYLLKCKSIDGTIGTKKLFIY